jgi:hypothetical protein
MKFKLENIKVNVAEEVQFELGKLEVEYSLEELMQMHTTVRDVLKSIDKHIDASDDVKEEKQPNTQMQDIFNSFADIYGKEKQNETAQEEN